MKYKIFIIACLLTFSLGGIAQYTHTGIFTNGGGEQTSGNYSNSTILGENMVSLNQTSGNFTNNSGYLFTNQTTAIYGVGEISGCELISLGEVVSYNVAGWSNADTYSWESSVTGISITENGSSANIEVNDQNITEFTLTVTPSNSYSQQGVPAELQIQVDATPVWPGDVNNDGVVDFNDMSFLVNSYSNYLVQTQGTEPNIPIRDLTCSGYLTYDWVAQAAQNSGVIMPDSDIDFKFADAYNDGVIEHDASTYYPEFGSMPENDGEIIKYIFYTLGVNATHTKKNAANAKLDGIEISIEKLNYPNSPQFAVRLTNNTKGEIRGITGRIVIEDAESESYTTDYEGSVLGQQSWNMQICDLLHQDKKTFDFTINRTNGNSIAIGANEFLYNVDFGFNESKTETAKLIIGDVFIMYEDNILYETITQDTVSITGNFTTSTNEQIEIEKISISPNPASDFISISGLSSTEVSTLKVVNLQGKTMISTQINDGKVNIQQLSTGVYFVRITNNKQTFTQKLVKVD